MNEQHALQSSHSWQNLPLGMLPDLGRGIWCLQRQHSQVTEPRCLIAASVVWGFPLPLAGQGLAETLCVCDRPQEDPSLPPPH